jgi:hypothetical protein
MATRISYAIYPDKIREEENPSDDKVVVKAVDR